MALLKGPEKNLKQIAGAIGVIQSLAWIIMALICIILYYTEPTDFSPYGYHYMDEVGEIIYQLYLKRYNQELYFDGQILTPGVFIGFSWVYLIIDLTWFATSWLVLLQKRGNLRRVFQIWSANTALVCLLDLIIIIILSSNYQKCLSEMGISLEIICANGILPVLVIASKGFVLWIVNAIFVVVVWKISKQLQQETPLNHFMPRANLQGSSNVGLPLQQVDAAYFQPYEHKPLSSAIPSAPFSTVPRSPVRQSWSIYAVQEPAQPNNNHSSHQEDINPFRRQITYEILSIDRS
ncbi:hypothetical protein MTP99_013498 [Tenebrio molitor]|nr:hypothetical protein MTP99_013498 [Tenebrio molitor]